MDYCDLMLTISTLACCIAEDKTADEVVQISSIYLQLAYTLQTIAVQKKFCSIKEETDQTDIFL